MSVQQAAWGDEWDEVADLVIVGSGVAGMAAAAIACRRGASVVVLEKADFTGGTTAKSGGVLWVPDNPVMRTAGERDDRDKTLHFLARTGHPVDYRADDPHLGLDPNTFAQLEAFFDNGHRLLAELVEAGALDLVDVGYPDYHPGLDDGPPRGRVIAPRPPEGWQRGSGPTMGQHLVDCLEADATANGARVLVGHQVGAIAAEHAVSLDERAAPALDGA